MLILIDISLIQRVDMFIISRVGKVSGIKVSGRVSGMPEMPGTKPGFGRPKLTKTINLENLTCKTC